MQNVDMTQPVEIEKDIYWVGSSEEALLRRNIYLRVYRFNGKTVSMIIDPGPECDLDIVPNTARSLNASVVLSNAAAFGGNNSCAVFCSAG